MQLLIIALITALMTLQYLLWVNEDGIRQTLNLRTSIQAQTEENAAFIEGNHALEADIKDLKTGLVAIEERARSEMGMVRQDETFYRLLEQSNSIQQNKSLQTTGGAPHSPKAVQPLAVFVPSNRHGTGSDSKLTNMPNTTNSRSVWQPDKATRYSVPEP